MSRREHPTPPTPSLPKPGDGQPPAGSADKAGYIRILPRSSAPPYVYQKKCETCIKTHDGTFGAGRFCSSRCARTVGGLAHRRKRLRERTLSKHPGSSSSSAQPPNPKDSSKPPKPKSGSSSSSKRKQSNTRMTISSLLNPS